MMGKILRLMLWIAAAAAILTGCKAPSNDDAAGDADNMMHSASLLRAEDKGDYIHVKILSADDSTRVAASYILVDKNKAVPDSLPQGTLLRTPLSNIAVFTSVFAGALDELGAADAVKGVFDAQYFKLPFIAEGLKSGRVADLGMSGNPSLEKIRMLKPEAILLSIYEGMDVKGIDKAGIPLINMADNLEMTPLGRAEWIRFLGLLTGKREKADSIFAAVEADYSKLRDEASRYKRKPTVLTENMYQGVWYVPGGKSYQARLIADAGGNYVFASDASIGSLSLGFEQVLEKGGEADIWLLKLYGQQLDKEALLAMDSRYRFFKAIDKGGVFFADTKEKPLFEEFPFHPERLLSDYIAIFHPESKLQTRYFQQMISK